MRPEGELHGMRLGRAWRGGVQRGGLMRHKQASCPVALLLRCTHPLSAHPPTPARARPLPYELPSTLLLLEAAPACVSKMPDRSCTAQCRIWGSLKAFAATRHASCCAAGGAEGSDPALMAHATVPAQGAHTRVLTVCIWHMWHARMWARASPSACMHASMVCVCVCVCACVCAHVRVRARTRLAYCVYIVSSAASISTLQTKAPCIHWITCLHVCRQAQSAASCGPPPPGAAAPKLPIIWLVPASVDPGWLVRGLSRECWTSSLSISSRTMSSTGNNCVRAWSRTGAMSSTGNNCVRAWSRTGAMSSTGCSQLRVCMEPHKCSVQHRE